MYHTFLLIKKYNIFNCCIVYDILHSEYYILVMVYYIMSNLLQNEQLSLKENPDSVELVKDSKTDNNKSKSVLKEIIHKAVTFTPASLDPDTKELNDAIDDAALESDPATQHKKFVKVTSLHKKHTAYKVFFKIHDVFGMRSNIQWIPRHDEVLYPWEITKK